MKKVEQTTEILVVGGGVAGIAASLSAAREGKKVLLAESTYMLGGLATSGLVAIYLPLDDGDGNQLSFSIAEELLKLAVSEGYESEYPSEWINKGTKEERISHRYRAQFNPHVFAILCEKLLLKDNVKILYGVTANKVSIKDKKITSVNFVSRTQEIKIKARSVIDATGDATICELSGENVKNCEHGNFVASWYAEVLNGEYLLRLKGTQDTDYYNNRNDNTFVGLQAKELSKKTIESHQFILKDFLKNGNDSTFHSLATIATIPQVRMTRRLVGKYELSINDNKKTFDDSLGMFGNWIKRGYAFELPARCLSGLVVDNLFVCGRCISVKEVGMWDIARAIPVCAVSGEACGVLSSQQLENNYNIESVQKILLSRGVKLHL